MREVLEIGVERITFLWLKRFSDFSEKSLKSDEGKEVLDALVDYFMDFYGECNNVTREMIETCLFNCIICKNDKKEIEHYTSSYDNYRIIAQTANYVAIETY